MKRLATIFLVVLSINLQAQLHQIRFESISSRDGLSHDRVSSIYQDELGFMWFGTRSGLNRYDGFSIKPIEQSSNNPLAPADPNVVWLKEGPNKLIWIKTNYGVFAYNTLKEDFVDISPLLNELQVDNYNLSNIIKDEIGNYWFLISGIGIKKYLASEKTVYHYGASYRDVTSIQPDNKGNMVLVHLDGEVEVVNIRDIRLASFVNYPEHIKGTPDLQAFVDSDGDFWFYSSSYSFGVCYFDVAKKKCHHYTEKQLGSNLTTGIIEDQNGRIIVGVDHGGLTLISKEDWSYQNFKNNPSDPKSLSHNSIIALYRDRSGLIWIGTNKGGVNYFSPKSSSFSFYKQIDIPSPSTNEIWPIVEDGEGSLWLGTDGGGLVHFNMETGDFKNYLHNSKKNSTLSSDIVASMVKSADGKGLWLGTYFGGLNYFDGKKFTNYHYDPDDPNSIPDNSVWALCLDSKDNLWVGTLKGGVAVYDKEHKLNHQFNLQSHRINSDYITSFCEDQTGKMWIGTGYGIEVYDPESGTIRHILKEEGNDQTLVNNSIIHIFCDQKNNMWIGTMYGLSFYDREKDVFRGFHKEDGLPENIVTAIQEDNEGNLWFSTTKGISKLVMDGDNFRFKNFDISDGLQGDIFMERSALKLSNGNLAFGGKNGLNIFDPSRIQIHDADNELVFLDFYISNYRINPGEEYNDRVLFEDGINSIEKLTLEHFENSFTFEFTSLNFYRQENMMYKYRLVGFDDDWILRPNIHRANYTNLDPGDYRFEVMATDQNHAWNNVPLSMDINIKTPLWKTPLAYLIYITLTVIALVLTRRSIIQKERFRARVANDKLESKRLHELDMMKIRFFTNISHEFRTPLTLILTPIEKLMNHTSDPERKKTYELIYRNAKRLLTLVNQLLDFRKMEANQHKLSPSTGNIIRFLKDITESFSDLSNDKLIRLNFETNVEEYFTSFDRDKIEKVMFNLLSNAFKFTHNGGKIEVKVEEVLVQNQTQKLRIAVSDTGIGIPGDRLDDVFNRFFQVGNDQKVNLNHGSGIGLSITKEFVEMHNGDIWVESKELEGSTFYIELPLLKLNGSIQNDEEVDNMLVVPDVHSDDKPTILIADDNADFRFYLHDNLKTYYNIYEAPNGKVAWKKMMDNLPDLVVTDIMMPELNGIGLCKKIKSDPRTAHIPVILLTAHYSDEQKLEGFESGAIEYITKPFNFEILVQAIKSAVQLQKQIHESEHRIEVKPAEIEITSLDQQFIEKAMSIVEENISNTNFSVQEMSRELAVSRGQLYKKCLELTGMTPIEFIRSIRLKRAAVLLEKSQLNVAEIAYKVGFNNPKYFTKYFKKAYKVLPSKYATAANH